MSGREEEVPCQDMLKGQVGCVERLGGSDRLTRWFEREGIYDPGVVKEPPIQKASADAEDAKSLKWMSCKVMEWGEVKSLEIIPTLAVFVAAALRDAALSTDRHSSPEKL